MLISHVVYVIYSMRNRDMTGDGGGKKSCNLQRLTQRVTTKHSERERTKIAVDLE